MAFKTGKFRDVFARRPVGRAIDVPNERSKKRAFGFVVEQKKWFWPTLTCVSVMLSGLIMVALVPGGFGRGVAVALATALAGGLCQSIRLFRKTQIKLMRSESKVYRTERKLEKFNIKILRELRLPLKNIRKKSNRIFEVSQSISKFAAPVAVSLAVGGDKEAQPDWRSITADARSICDSASRLDRLPAGLLRIGRVRNVEFAPNWLDMNTLLISALTALKHEIHEAGAKVMFKDIPCCVGDDGLVREMFRALISNSIENLSPDRDGLIRIWGQYAGSRNIYCIEDNGIGIAAEEFEDIFEMFYRIKKGTGKQGIGLALVKDVVSRHNGRIWLKSTPGKGSTFSVALPAR